MKKPTLVRLALLGMALFLMMMASQPVTVNAAYRRKVSPVHRRGVPSPELVTVEAGMRRKVSPVREGGSR